MYGGVAVKAQTAVFRRECEDVAVHGRMVNGVIGESLVPAPLLYLQLVGIEDNSSRPVPQIVKESQPHPQPER